MPSPSPADRSLPPNISSDVENMEEASLTPQMLQEDLQDKEETLSDTHRERESQAKANMPHLQFHSSRLNAEAV